MPWISQAIMMSSRDRTARASVLTRIFNQVLSIPSSGVRSTGLGPPIARDQRGERDRAERYEGQDRIRRVRIFPMRAQLLPVVGRDRPVGRGLVRRIGPR